jgi:photosystem II stability/assembly factor-like uncharacterized protein
MSKAVPALFLAFVAVILSYAFAHRTGDPKPATQVRIETTMIMSAASVGDARVAVGERGRIFRQADAKSPWLAVKSPTESTLTRVHFLDAQQGLAVGHDQVILRTTDAGKTWKQVFIDAEAETPIFDVVQLDANRAIAIGAYGLFLESVDGGATWASRFILPEGEDRHLNAIAKLADGTLMIAGEAGTILRSSDAGANWQKVDSPYAGSFFGVQPLGGTQVIMYGMRGKLLRSDDNGASFVEVAVPIATSLFGSAIAADGRVLVSGQNGELLISRDGAQTFTNTKVDGRPMLSSVLPTATGADVFGEKGLHAAATN